MDLLWVAMTAFQCYTSSPQEKKKKKNGINQRDYMRWRRRRRREKALIERKMFFLSSLQVILIDDIRIHIFENALGEKVSWPEYLVEMVFRCAEKKISPPLIYFMIDV